MSAATAVLLVPALLALAQDAPRKFDLPMQMRGAMPALEVMVHGEGPFLFGLDTGASGAGRVDAALAEKLGLAVVGEAQGGDGSGRATPMRVVAVEHLDVGGLAFEGLELPSRDYNRGGNLPRIDGILGYGLFAEGVLTLDFPAKRVRYDSSASLPAPDGRDVLALAPGPIASFELTIGAHKVPAHIDSGNVVGRFVLPAELVAKLTAVGEPRAMGKARTVSGEMDILQVAIAETIAIGRHEFPKESVTYPSPGPYANVGSTLLAGLRVSFDQRNARMRLEKP